MNRVFFKIVLLICLTGATYAELPIASENDQKTDFTNCDWNFKEIWDEYLESNDKEFNMIAPNGKKKTILSENVSYMRMVIMLII